MKLIYLQKKIEEAMCDLEVSSTGWQNLQPGKCIPLEIKELF